MAIAVVQTASGGGLYSASGTAYGATFSSAPTNGNLMIGVGTSDGVQKSTTGVGPNFNYIGAKVVGFEADINGACKYVVGDVAAETSLFVTTEANIYATCLLLELSGAQSSGGYSVQTFGYNVTPSSQTYTAPSIITPSSGSAANGVGILFSCFGIEDYNGITSATPPSGWTLLGPFAQNGGAVGTNNPIKLYVMYLLAPTTATTYNPVLTYVGTPNNASATVLSFCINNYVASSALAYAPETSRQRFYLLNTYH